MRSDRKHDCLILGTVMKERKRTKKQERKEKEIPAPRDTIQGTLRAENILPDNNTCASLIEQQMFGLDQSPVISAPVNYCASISLQALD
jgi:hypothetical protein